MKKYTFFVLVIFLLIFSSGCIGKRRRIPAALTETAVAASQVESQVEEQAVPETEATAPPSSAPAPSGSVLFKDDFQDGTPDNWSINAGWDVQQDGDIYYFSTAIKGSAWVPGGHNWDDYVFRSAIQVNNGTAALNFRLTQEGRYLVTFSQDGLYLLKEAPAGNVTVLTKVNPVSLGEWHWVTLGGEGGHIMVYVDQVLKIDFQDADPLPSGTIAVAANDATNVMVDDILVHIPENPFPTFNASISPPVADVPAPDIAGPPLAEMPSVDDVVEEVVEEHESSGPAQVNFTIEGSDSVSINAGDCITVSWNVSNALEVYFQGNAANASGFIDDCPSDTINYVLEVIDLNGAMTEYVVSANVSGGDGGGGEEGLPDLSMSVDFSEPRTAGQSFAVVMHIHNTGTADSGFFTAVWFSAPDVVGCSADLSVPAGQTVDSVCQFAGYPESGMYNWSAEVDIEGEVQESNEGNNSNWGGVRVE